MADSELLRELRARVDVGAFGREMEALREDRLTSGEEALADTERKRRDVRAQASKLRRGMLKWSCESCGWSAPKVVGQIMHLHHVRPVSAGGRNDRDNLVSLCPNCHALAHRMMAVDREALLEKLKALLGSP